MKKLSISIVNTNNRGLLKKCLESIYKNPPNYDFEILVVDNKSDDGSAEMVSHEFPSVILTKNTEQNGYSKNNNINISKSRGEYILVLNEDVELAPGTLDTIGAYMDKHPRIGLLACKMIKQNGEVILTSARRFPSLLNEFLGWSTLAERFPKNKFFGKYLMSYWGHNSIREVDTCCEAGMLVRRKTIDEVGMMDEDLFFGSDGPEWCKRIKNARWKVVFHSDAVILHVSGACSKKNESLKTRIYIESLRSKFIYYRKYHGIYYAFSYKILIAGMTGCIILKQLISKLLFGSKVQNIDERIQNNFIMFCWAIGALKRKRHHNSRA